MKRDMDLIRALLLEIEEEGRPTVGESQLHVDWGCSDDERVDYHLSLLVEAELIIASVASNPDVRPVRRVWPHRLTWKGHEFVESVRDADTWKTTKDGALAVGGWTFDLVKDLAKGIIKKQIEERSGVKL